MQAFAAQVVARSSAPGATSASGARTGQLSLSQPGDAHEREAESVADKVMRMADPSTTRPLKNAPTGAVIQRRCAECEEEGKGAKVQRKEGSAAAPQITPSVSAGISALQGGGSPLPASSRAFFEPRFGANLSNIRVHTGSQAADTASAINARAFTVGRDIAFNAGQYAPHSQEGQRLLAHELTHVVQQTGTSADGSGGTIMRAGFPGLGLPAGSPGPKYPTPPKQQPSEAAVRAAAEEVVELKGHTTFDPSPALGEMINYLSPQTALSVRVRFGNLAQGRIDIRLRDGYFISTEDPAMIELKHPAFPGNGYLAPPRLLLSVVNSAVTGRVQFFPWDRLRGSVAGAWLKANPLQALLGWKGVDRIRPALAVNEVKGGVLRYRLENFTYRLDGEWEGLGNFDVTDEKVQFAAETNIKAPGVANAKMPLEWTAGNVFGSANLSLALAPKDLLGGKFSGSLEGSFAGGVTNITGEASYSSQKVNGTVTIRVAPLQEAWAQLAAHQLPGPGKLIAAAGPDTTHAVFGWGVLDFHFNEWLSGRASVIVDPQGFITTYGVIRPVKEWSFLEGGKYGDAATLFDKPLGGFVVPTGIGFSTITGTLAAKVSVAGRVGPITIYDLELAGVYSTNPGVPNALSLGGVINVSAIGEVTIGLTGTLSYKALGPVGEVAGVDVEVTGSGVLKAYALLKPTFSVEKPKDGDARFRVKAKFKVAGGLYVGLGGSIKARVLKFGLPRLRSGQYQWLLGGVGLTSDVDYVLGDKAGPKLDVFRDEFKEADFKARAEQLLKNKGERDDKKKKETEVHGKDEVERAPPATLPPPKIVKFTMNRVEHQLWVEGEPEPQVIMQSRRGPLKKKLGAELAQLKQEEAAAEGSGQALIKAEEKAVAALNRQRVDVESSAASLERRQADVAGMQELARQIQIYSKQFSKQEIGDRTDDMQTDQKDLFPQEGLVGTFRELDKAGSTDDQVTPHHMPQESYMESKLQGNPGGEKWVYKDGICMNMFQPTKKGVRGRTGRHYYTRSYKRRPNLAEKPMEALQKDIANVRAIYEKEGLLKGRVENGLTLLHALNVKNYPKLFRGG